MKPTKSSLNKTSCTPVSSNCVDWEGEILESIEVCEKDSISDIVKKLDTALAFIQKQLDLSAFDLGCLVQTCIACPDPEKTLANVLKLTKEKVCSLTGVTSTTVPQAEKVMALASCFQGTKNSEGDEVTKLPHSDYTVRIAQAVCQLTTTVKSQGLTIGQLTIDIETLKRKVGELSEKVKVSPLYTFPDNSPRNFDVVLEAVEQQFGQLREVTGTTTMLTQAIGKQCTNLATSQSLTQGAGSTMSSLNGWIVPAAPNSGTVAAAINNLWLTMCDVRAAVKTMQDNCCKITCDSIVVDFDIKLSDDRQIATLYFGAKTKLPNGFRECNALGTKITIMDAAGHTFDRMIQIKQLIGTPPGVDDDGSWGSKEIDLSSSSIDPSMDYTFSMEACITNGELTCQKCVTKTATYKDTCSFCEFSAIGKGSASGVVIITYEEL